MHLIELSEKICENFDGYALGRDKMTQKATIFRVVGHDGNMNPAFSTHDIVPGDSVEAKLKYRVSWGSNITSVTFFL